MASTTSTAIVLLAEKDARALTERIRASTNELGQLLLEAKEGEAYKALGYSTWGAYIEAEFDFKRSRSYQLLTQAKVNRTLETSGSPVRVTESEARSVSTNVDAPTIEQEVISHREAPISRIRNGGDSFPTDSFDDGEAMYECRHCHRVEPLTRYVMQRPAQSEFE